MFRVYWNIQRILVPGLKYSQEIYEEVLIAHLDEDTIWLDLGCGEDSKTELKRATA
jgi:hypothetical protein